MLVVCSGSGPREAIMAEAEGRGPLWLPEARYLGHTTTSKNWLTGYIELFINWLLGLTWTPGVSQTIIVFIGHYRYYQAIMGCPYSHIVYRPAWSCRPLL